MDHLNIAEEQKDQGIVQQIVLAMKNIRYGSVEVVIQDSKVVQIEIKEKVRFDQDGLRKEK
ncbi:MAG: YezD family protein [Nitrospira sp.]|nr:YezD family protein [Nitrospira sp.]